MNNKLKIGDKVIWRNGWGASAPVEAEIESIENYCVGKYGTSVTEVDWSECIDRSVIVMLTNGHWAYGFQLERIIKRPKRGKIRILN